MPFLSFTHTTREQSMNFEFFRFDFPILFDSNSNAHQRWHHCSQNQQRKKHSLEKYIEPSICLLFIIQLTFLRCSLSLSLFLEQLLFDPEFVRIKWKISTTLCDFHFFKLINKWTNRMENVAEKWNVGFNKICLKANAKTINSIG